MQLLVTEPMQACVGWRPSPRCAFTRAWDLKLTAFIVVMYIRDF